MRSDLITVVTGDPRSGTSLQMQTLHLLGVPVAGDVFPDTGRHPKTGVKISSEDIIDMRIKHARGLNPNGFLEVPGVVAKGLQDISGYEGKAIKIISSGVWVREGLRGRRIGTPTELVDKYILCLRDPKHVAVSQQDLISNILIEEEEDPEFEWGSFKLPMRPLRYLNGTGRLGGWLGIQEKEVLDKFLIINFENMITSPREQINRIIAHLDISPNNDQINAAVNNVDITLRRSSNNIIKWAKNDEIEGALADDVYEALKIMDTTALLSYETKIIEFFETLSLERRRWLDEEFWVTIDSQTKRAILQNINGLKDQYLENVEKYKEKNLICTKCPHYSRDATETYTIERAPDFGSLKRPLVDCKRDKEFRTIEQCNFCWQRGWLHNGKEYGPQRDRS